MGQNLITLNFGWMRNTVPPRQLVVWRIAEPCHTLQKSPFRFLTDTAWCTAVVVSMPSHPPKPVWSTGGLALGSFRALRRGEWHIIEDCYSSEALATTNCESKWESEEDAAEGAVPWEAPCQCLPWSTTNLNLISWQPESRKVGRGWALSSERLGCERHLCH